jgi:hypothetical protein
MALRAVFLIVIVRRASRTSCGTGRWELALFGGLYVPVLVHESIDRVVDERSSVDVEGTLRGGIEDVVLGVQLLWDKRVSQVIIMTDV